MHVDFCTTTRSHHGGLLVVAQGERAPVKGLLQDPPFNAFVDVPHVQDSTLWAQDLLLKVPDSKPVEQVLFAAQQLEELQVCVWPRDNDGRAAPAKYVLSLLHGGGEEPQAPGAALMVATSLSLFQVTPSDKRAAKPLRSTRRALIAWSHVLQATWGARLLRTRQGDTFSRCSWMPRLPSSSPPPSPVPETTSKEFGPALANSFWRLTSTLSCLSNGRCPPDTRFSGLEGH